MLIRMCEAQNITMLGQPPNPLDSLPSNLSFGNSTIPETSLPENLQPPRRVTLELLEYKADEKQKPTILQRVSPVVPALTGDVERDGVPLLTALKALKPFTLMVPRVLARHFSHLNRHKYWRKKTCSLGLHAWSNVGFGGDFFFWIILFSQAPR